MTERKYDENIIKDAIQSGLIDCPENVTKFRFAHYRGINALREYYTNLPKTMMSVTYRPPREAGSRMIQKLINYQYDGLALDKIILAETKILRDQLQLFNLVMNYNSKNTILTKDHRYSYPIHSSEQISLDDTEYLDVREVAMQKLSENPDCMRTREDIENFMDEYFTDFMKDDECRVDKLITYFRIRQIL